MVGTTLRVFYILDDKGVQTQLEKELEKILGKYGYTLNPNPRNEIESNLHVPGEIRDLRFTRPVEEGLFDIKKSQKGMYPGHEDLIKQPDPGGDEDRGEENGPEI